jgi:hypothetical protein
MWQWSSTTASCSTSARLLRMQLRPTRALALTMAPCMTMVPGPRLAWSGNMRTRGDHGRQGVAQAFEQGKKPDARFRRLDLAQGDQGVGAAFAEGRKFGVAAQDWIAQHGPADLIGHAHQSGNDVAALQFDYVDAGAGMAASAHQEDCGLGHARTSASCALLGTLMRRAARDSAQARFMAGQSR